MRGLDLVELPGAEECCGFGGTFAVKNADTSVAMGADKARHVRETGAEVLVAGDNSCLMHIGGHAVARSGAGVRVDAPRRDPRRRPRTAGLERSLSRATFVGMPAFPDGRARRRWPTPSCARNLAHATRTIRAKRAAVVAEVADWEELRLAGAAIKDDTPAPPRRRTSCSSRRR